MSKKANGRRPPVDLKFIGSLRSQRSIKEQWRLESDLKTAKAQVGMWERKLKEAREGVERQTRQVTSGVGLAHSILESYVQDVRKAEDMIAAFKDQAANLQAQIDALMPDSVRSRERAETQRSLRLRILARLELDRKLDMALESVREILEQRAVATSEMSEQVAALEFNHNVNLDAQRFESLLHTLPSGMARESQAWVTWFLGSEGDRAPGNIPCDNVVLFETLKNHNAFRCGDQPMLTKKEEALIDQIRDSRVPPTPFDMEPRAHKESLERVPDERLQWALLR